MIYVQMKTGTAKLSAEDADLADGRWHRSATRGYASRNALRGTRKTKEYMHRVVAARMGLPIEGLQVDHIDGDPLNNSRENLRVSTPAQNQQNRRTKRTGSSQYKGVSWSKSAKRWRATIVIGGKQRWLGDYDCELAAARVYRAAASASFGDFAAPHVRKVSK